MRSIPSPVRTVNIVGHVADEANMEEEAAAVTPTVIKGCASLVSISAATLLAGPRAPGPSISSEQAGNLIMEYRLVRCHAESTSGPLPKTELTQFASADDQLKRVSKPDERLSLYQTALTPIMRALELHR